MNEFLIYRSSMIFQLAFLLLLIIIVLAAALFLCRYSDWRTGNGAVSV